ncbi:SET domain-containing protein 9 [Blattella germanica]|nr:SET domain-containing protein 9 [Blattella germanica]
MFVFLHTGDMFSNLIKKWRGYRHRFVPWIAFNLTDRSKRIVKKNIEDKIVDDSVLLDTLLKLLPRLHSANTKFSSGEVALKNSEVIQSVLGFCIKRAPSTVPEAGIGVVVSAGNVERGSLVALYPGTLYRPHEPILFPSIGNSFVLRCIDGIHVDGNDKRMSKIIYKSCVGRDSVKPHQAADLTWLTDTPVMPLNIGQYVNNQSPGFAANVAYQELDVPLSLLPSNLRCFLPNIWYRSSHENNFLRLVTLVSTTKIQQGQEVFSTYYTVVH